MSEKDAGRGFLEKSTNMSNLFTSWLVHFRLSGVVYAGVSLHNAKLLLSLGKICTKSHETWNMSKVVSTFSMAREKLSPWKDAWEDSNPPKMLGVSAFGQLRRDGHIKYLAISSASWYLLLKFFSGVFFFNGIASPVLMLRSSLVSLKIFRIWTMSND